MVLIVSMQVDRSEGEMQMGKTSQTTECAAECEPLDAGCYSEEGWGGRGA